MLKLLKITTTRSSNSETPHCHEDERVFFSRESLPRISLLLKRCFSPTWTRKNRVKNATWTGENVSALAGKKNGNFLTLNRLKYAGILISNLPPSLKCFSATWTRKIESTMRFEPAKTCPLWPAKKGNFLTSKRSKYAGILVSNLPPSLKMFFGHLDTKNRVNNAIWTGENVSAFRTPVCFGRQQKRNFLTLNRSKYAGILVSNLPLRNLKRSLFNGSFHLQKNWKIRTSRRSPSASQQLIEKKCFKQNQALSVFILLTGA